MGGSNTLQRPGQFDALEKVKPNEQIFPLVEHDPCAPAAILYWCDLRRQLAREIKDKDKRKEELQQITEAEFIAFAMQDKQRGIEADQGKRSSNSGIANPDAIRDECMRKLRANLGDADYHASEACELMGEAERLGVPAITVQIAEIAKTAQVALHEIALKLSPNRARYLAEKELPIGEE